MHTEYLRVLYERKLLDVLYVVLVVRSRGRMVRSAGTVLVAGILYHFFVVVDRNEGEESSSMNVLKTNK